MMGFESDISKYISFEDYETFKLYEPFFRCYFCSKLMTNPKYCSCCSRSFCENCTPDCATKTVTNRHIDNLMDTLYLKCRGFDVGDCKNKIKYKEFFNHIYSCSYNPIVEKVVLSYESNKSFQPSLITHKESSEAYFKSKIFLPIKNPEKQRISCICPKCKKEFSSFKMKIHIQECFIQYGFSKASVYASYSSQLEELSKKVKSAYEKKFQYYKFCYKDKTFTQLKFIVSNYLLLRDEAIDNIKKLNSELLRADPQLSIQQNVRKKLKEERNLIEIFINEQVLTQSNSDIQLELKNKLKQQINDNDKQSNASTITEKSSSEKLEDISCYKCHNKSADNKYLCLNCKKDFCKYTCISKCISSNHIGETKYLCPNEEPKCSLCKRVKFCKDCQKPCFYQYCKLTFCPPCYLKNAFQKLKKSNSCSFSKCESCCKASCIMAIAYCNKCNKRLCSKCIFSNKHDKYHIEDIFKTTG